MVHEDTVYLCTSHDEDVTVDGFFTMNDWFVFSSKDMVNWTDHGIPLSWDTFSWAEANKSWAPHCVARDGQFYFYVPVNDKIGVAVADSPTGPFRDAIGAPLLTNYQYIDPSVFIDDDGQAYLYFGNPRLWYVKLNEDMVSFSGTVQEIPMTTQSFGERRGGPTADRATSYEEGPWFYKRSDLYYMVYPTGELPEHIAYSTSAGPTGPWSYGGEIMNSVSGHAFTNHPGIIDFKGRSYFFYHTQELPGGDGFKRSTAIEEFTYNADGSIPTIQKTREGVTESVAPLSPYYRVEGETMAWGQGIEVEDCSEGGRNLANLEAGDYVKVESVDFLTGPVSFEASVASAGAGGTLELRLDAVDGTLLGSCAVEPTGDWQTWDTVSCDVAEATGIHDLFLVFEGGNGMLFNVDYWQFTPKDPLPTGTGGAGGTGGESGVGGGAAAGGAPATGGMANSGGMSGSTGGSSAVGGSTPGSGGALTGTGGAPSGGASTTGGATTTSSGGLPGDGGPAAPGDSPDAAGGCAVSVGTGSAERAWVLLLLGALAVGRSRRQKVVA